MFSDTWGEKLLPGKIPAGKNSAGKNSVPILILPGKNYCPVQLGEKKYIDRREAPEIFDSILPIIGVFV